MLAGGIAASSFVVFQSASATAGVATKGGVIHVYEVGTAASDHDTDVITGAFADHGIDKPVVTDKLNKLVLSKGTFEVNLAALGKRIAPHSYDPTTCSIVLAGSAPTHLLDGTGAYKGITGTVTISITEAEILPRLKNGNCDQGKINAPVADVDIIRGSGTVSFK